MLEYREFTPEAMAELKPFIALQRFRSNDYTVNGLYMWRDYFGARFAVTHGMLVTVYDFEGGSPYYTYPVGPGSEDEALEEIRRDARERKNRLRFCCVPKEKAEKLAAFFGPPKLIEARREWADYLYPYENFLGYHGKKLTTQRNHCNRFLRDNPDMEYVALTRENAGEAKAFLREHEDVFKKHDPMVEEDYNKCFDVLDHFDGFGFTGGMLKAGGRVVGLTVGEALDDTLYVHIEKALASVSGVYPMLARLYAEANARPELRYINREDDSGDAGLRHSKTEYRPIELIDKFVMEF